MRPTLLALIAAIALAGCSSTRNTTLASCSGPAVQLNPGRWTPTEAQAARMNALAQEVCR